MKPIAIRLGVLCVLFLEAQWILSLYHPEDDFSTVLLIAPLGLLTGAILIYATFTLWRMWRKA